MDIAPVLLREYPAMNAAQRRVGGVILDSQPRALWRPGVRKLADCVLQGLFLKSYMDDVGRSIVDPHFECVRPIHRQSCRFRIGTEQCQKL